MWLDNNLRGDSPLSHTRERAKRLSGEEFGRLAASPLDFALTTTSRSDVLQREPARRLAGQGQAKHLNIQTQG